MAENEQDLHFLDYLRVMTSRKEIVIAVFLMVVMAGILVTVSLPKVYMASSVIQIKREQTDIRVFQDSPNLYDPLFLRTNFEIIQSRPVIEAVVQKLGLSEKLGKAYGYFDGPQEQIFDQTCKILSNSLRVQQFRDTNLIEIRVFMSEPRETVREEVARTADTVADSFRLITMQRSRQTTERGIEAVLLALNEQRDKVVKAEEKVVEVRAKYGISLLEPLGGSGGTPLDQYTLTQLESRRIDLRIEMEGKKARYESIKDLPPADLMAVAPTVVPDAALSALVAAKREADIELSKLLRQGYGEKHPDVDRVRAVNAELEKNIQEALKGLLAGVKTEYETARARHEAMETELEKKKAISREDRATGYLQYEKAKEDETYQKRIRDALEMRYLEEKTQLRIPKTTVELIEPAKVPAEKDNVSPNILLNIILSLLAGLIGGCGSAFFVEYLDTSVKTIDDVERHLKIPVLGVIPQKVKPFVDEPAEGANAEAYRVLRTNIQFSNKLNGGKMLCATSGSVGEGKSLTLFNLAYICAQQGDKVLLVDSDLHRPRQHKILGISNSMGLMNYLIGSNSLEECITPTGVSNLDIITSGRLATGSVHGLMEGGRLRELVSRVREMYDLVFFDSPPIIGVSDTSLLVREMDGVMLVVQHRKYPRSVSQRAKAMVENLGANLIGVVLNNISISRDYSYYYYHQHYYYYPRHGSKGSA